MSHSVDQVIGFKATSAMNGSDVDAASLFPDRNNLMLALSNQLIYYFSPANLLKDTFIMGVMNLNSGCVPIEILANFSNIQRLITTFYPHAYEEDTQNFLFHAACCTDTARQYLRIIVVDQYGHFVAKFGEEYTKSDGCTYSIAIGPSLPTPQLESPLIVSNETTARNIIIILRDVSDQASEDDIRAVFTHPSSVVIKSIHKDVEHCWFVTMDAMTTKDEIFSLLSSLRTKSIRGEPVKARLKTQSTPSSSVSLDQPQVGTSVGNTSTTRSFSSAFVRAKTSDTQQHTQVSPHVGKPSNPSGNKMHQHSKHQHTTDSVSEKFPARKTYGVKETGGSKSQRSHGRSKRGTHNSTQIDVNGKEKHENGVSSLSQFGEKDFPSLGMIKSSKEEKNGSGNDDDDDDVKKTQDVNSGNILTSPATTVKVMNGYAAALLKPTPINPPILLNSENLSENSSTNMDSKTVTKESNNGTTSSRSSATAPTDDSSADDKSLSSKPDSDKGGSCTSPPMTTSPTLNKSTPWSKNAKSFADVLKKQN